MAHAVVKIKTENETKEMSFDKGYFYESTLFSQLGGFTNSVYIENEYLPSTMPGVSYTYIRDLSKKAYFNSKKTKY